MDIAVGDTQQLVVSMDIATGDSILLTSTNGPRGSETSRDSDSETGYCDPCEPCKLSCPRCDPYYGAAELSVMHWKECF